MTEQKLFEGVYFTDYRQTGTENSKPQCLPKITPEGNMIGNDPLKAQFITLEQLILIKDPAQISYLLSAILHRHEWLLESTSFMLDDKELWADPDVSAAIEENIPLIDKYTEMLEWVIEKPDRCHAVEKGDHEKVAKARLKSEETKKLYEEFQNSRGLLV